MAASRSEAQQAIKGVWYGLLLFGLLTLGLGVFLIVEPNETIKVLTVIVGIFLLVDGVLAIISSLVSAGDGRAMLAFVGALSAIAGIVLIKKPFETLVVFALIVGVWFVVAGVVRFVAAFAVPEGRAGFFFVAVIDVIAGIVILSWPELTLSTLAVIIGIVLVIRGALLVYGAWHLLRLEKA
jgi:uncharacterized membrane protein HdeD (DUF308 family)